MAACSKVQYKGERMGKYIKQAVGYIFDYPWYLCGLWSIARLPHPIVTIFGGRHVVPDSECYEKAYTLAKLLAIENISVLSGGGPGIMEAVLCGSACQRNNRALGVGVRGVDVEYVSRCNQRAIYLSDFGMRKHFLIDYASGFVAFPGGLGTMDEIATVLNLIKNKKIDPAPVLLIGKEYWKCFGQWVLSAIECGYIESEYTYLFEITDDLNYVAMVMKKHAYKTT
jgi:uncharacterized protein (TIGR00730 family)